MQFGFRLSFNFFISSNVQPDKDADVVHQTPIAVRAARRGRVAQTTRATQQKNRRQCLTNHQRINMSNTPTALSTPETDQASLHRLMYHTHRLEMQGQYFRAPFKSPFDLETYRSSSPDSQREHQEALITLEGSAERQPYLSLSNEEFEDHLSRDIAAGKAEQSMTDTLSLTDLKERLLAAGWSEEFIEGIASWSAGLVSRESEVKSLQSLFEKVENKDAEEQDWERLVQVAGFHESMVGGNGKMQDGEDALEVGGESRSAGGRLADTEDEASGVKEAEREFDDFVDCRSQPNSHEEGWCFV